jgi:hypothetical protein
MRFAGALLAALAALLLAAPAASAHALIRVADGQIIYLSPDAPSLSSLTVRLVGDRIEFRDPTVDQGIEIGPCEPGDIGPHGNPIQAFCPAAGITQVRIDVTEREDAITYGLGVPGMLLGGPGADQIIASDAADTLDGGDGNDRLSAGGGNDVVIGGAGADDIDAGPGDDTLRTRDGEQDIVRCGDGLDNVDADTFDDVAVDCEGVARTQTAPPPDAGAIALDKTAPVVDSGAATRQRLGRRGVIRIAITSSERGSVGASGFLDVAGLSLPIPLVRARIDVAGAGAELRIRLSARQLREARRALRRKRRVTVRLSVVATDLAGNSAGRNAPRIRLRR